MPTVQFTSQLRRYFPTLRETDVQAATILEALNAIERHYPGIRDYLLDESGALRKHVNIFIHDQPIPDRGNLAMPLPPDARLYVFQALSGG